MNIEILDIENINSYHIKNSIATFFLRYKGTGWDQAGIFDNDILLIDRSQPLNNNDLIIAAWAGKSGFKLKRYITQNNSEFLMDNQGNMQKILTDSGFELWGVVAYSIHSFK